MRPLNLTPAQSELVVRAFKTIALADGTLHPQERRMIEFAAEFHGVAGDLDALPPITPEALAAGLDDPELRRALVKRLVVMTTLDGDVTRDEVAEVERFAAALGIDERAVKNIRQLAEGHARIVIFDLGRRSFMPGAIKGVWRREGLAGLWKIARAALGLPDPAQEARFTALAELPAGSLGRTLHDHFVDNGFPIPGRRHGVPDMMLFHDVGHVLSGYGTEPEGELLVASFQAGYLGEGWLEMYLLIAMLFQLAIEPAARLRGVEARRELIDYDTFQAAFDRGAAMKRSLIGWDPWPHMGRPLAEVRAELGIT